MDKIDSLSKAMRYGALFVRPLPKVCLTTAGGGSKFAGCAIGSAVYGIGHEPGLMTTLATSEGITRLERHFPWLNGLMLRTPPRGDPWPWTWSDWNDWHTTIINLFDHRKWSADQIADYLKEVGL